MLPSLLRYLPIALALPLLGGCPHRTPREPPSRAAPASPPLSETEEARARANELARWVDARLDRQNSQLWAAWTEGERIDPVAFADTERVDLVEAIQKVTRAWEIAADATSMSELAALRAYLVGEHLAEQLAETDDAIASLQASLKLEVGEDELLWRNVERELTREVSPKRRRAIYEAAAMAGARLAPLLRRRDQRMDELLRELGYPERGATLAYAADLRQSDFTRLATLAEELLTATQEPYRKVMDRLARRELGHAFAKATRADIPRLFRRSQVDEAFGADTSIARVKQTFEGMGLPLEAMSHLVLDERDLQAKNPRPISLLVGDAVRVSVRPQAGVRSQAAALRELGHAFALTPLADQRNPYARLRSGATALAFGVLFSDLTEDAQWLEEFARLEGKTQTNYLAAANAHRLYLLRQMASRLLYQLALLRAGTPVGTNEARQTLKEMMSRADQLPVTDVDVLWAEWSLGDLLSEADALRSAFLAAQLQSELKVLGGPSWWRSREAGAALAGWVKQSVGKSPREVAQLLGAPGVQVDTLLLRMSTALGVPIQLRGAVREFDGAR